MPVHWRGVIIADPGIPSPLNHGIGFQLADRTKKVADGNTSKTHRSHVEINAAEFVFLRWNHFSFSSSVLSPKSTLRERFVFVNFLRARVIQERRAFFGCCMN